MKVRKLAKLESLRPPPGARHAGVPEPSELSTAPDATAHQAIEELLNRMQGGDRSAAAMFMTRYGSRLQRRIRGKLRPGMRRLYDTQDILSTISRRLDRYVLAGRLDVNSEEQLWALLLQMVNHAVVDRVRVFARLEQAETEDGAFARVMLARMHHAESDNHHGTEMVIDQAVEHLTDDTNRRILLMWLDQRTHVETASIIGLSAAAVRQRWQTIKSQLLHRFTLEYQ